MTLTMVSTFPRDQIIKSQRKILEKTNPIWRGIGNNIAFMQFPKFYVPENSEFSLKGPSSKS